MLDADGGAPPGDAGPVPSPKPPPPPPPPPPDGAAPPPSLISTSTETLFEAETDLAVTPDGTLVAAWIASNPNSTNYARMGYAFSKDDGITWTTPAFTHADPGHYQSDPALASDAQGNVYLSFIDIVLDGQGGILNDRVVLAMAPKGSTTFGAPIHMPDPTNDDFHDHPWVTVTAAGTIVVMFTAFASADGTAGSTGIAATSKDGISWTATKIVESTDGSAFYNLFYPCTAKGRLWVSYWAGNQNLLYVGLKASDNEGETFGAEIIASDPSELNADFATCTTDGTRVAVVYGTSITQAVSDNDQPQLDAVRLAISDDQGATFTRSTLAGKGAMYMHPRFVRHADSAFDVVYYQGAADGDHGGTLRRARIAANGSLAANEALGGPITFSLDRSSQAWLGDYVGVIDRAGSLYATYADNSSGVSHVAFRRAGK
jgi:hypothetical protein